MTTLPITPVFACLLLIPACGQDNTAAGSYTVDIKPTIDGIIETESAGKELPAEQRAAMETMFKGMFEKMNFNLNADLTCTGDSEITIMGTTKKSSTKGTWSIEGGKVTINTTHEDGEEKASTQTGTYKDGKLTIDMEQAGKKITLYLKKK